MDGKGLFSFFLACFVSGSVISIARAGGGAHQCKGIRTKRHAQISTPPNIGGSWFSPRCELLPGPQFLLRQYEFTGSGSDNTRFTVTRYYYSDEFCREVSYAIQASGTLTAQSKSWILNEATDMSIKLNEVSVKPYTTMMSTVLKAQIMRVGCVHNYDPNIWSLKPFQEVQVNSTNQDCLQAVSFSINELLVMRQVDYYNKNKNSGRSPRMSLQVERELQLGNGVWYSLVDTPSSYQPPLYSVTHRHCVACDCIYRADINNPPVRCHGTHVGPSLPYNISGHWFSQTCESVPYSLFTLRSYEFDEADSTFNITTYYFTDAFCTQQSFMLRAEGILIAGQPHSRIYNTKSYQLIFKKVYVAVLSDVMLELLQLGDSSYCGHVTAWEIGKMYDVTNTGGCRSLGLVIHDFEYVLVKAEQHHSQSKFILLSEMKSDPLRFDDEITHFTPKLKKCDSEPVRWVKRNSAKFTTSTTIVSSISGSIHTIPYTNILSILLGVILTMT